MTRWLLLLAWLLAAAAGGARAQDMTLDGELSQGGLVWGTTQPGTKAELDGRSVRVSDQGRFLLGFGRDAAPLATLALTFPDGRESRYTLEIAQREYKIQRIDGLPPEKVTPPPEVLARIQREIAMVAAVRAVDRPDTWFEGGFVWPVTGPISGIYGSQRILNGEPRHPHMGVDVAAPAGTPVKAPADGLVVLVQPDMYYSGGTIIIDHGHGLTSSYLHMRDVLAKEGQMVKQGDPIGTVGATGRVTGAHLDWRFNWFDQRLDPELVAGPMTESQ